MMLARWSVQSHFSTSCGKPIAGAISLPQFEEVKASAGAVAGAISLLLKSPRFEEISSPVASDECGKPCHRITANGGDSVASDECGKPYALREKLSGLAFYGYGLSLCMAGLGGRIAGGFGVDKLQVFVHVCAGAVNGNGQAGVNA